MYVRILFVAIAILLISSCGSTLITTEPESSAYSIYLNGKLKGNAPVKVPKVGIPRKYLVEVKDGENVIGSQTIKRHFKLFPNALVCCISPYLIILTFEFDRKYTIPIDRSKVKSKWEPGGKSAWD